MPRPEIKSPKTFYEIQTEVGAYVMQRPLHRPRINRALAIIILITDVLLALAISFAVGLFFGIAAFIPLIFIFIFIHTLRPLGVVFVKCYQRHASETRRRRCLCMPTCSEYAILCFKKHIFFHAIFKIRKRLLVTCKGNDYKIDWP